MDQLSGILRAFARESLEDGIPRMEVTSALQEVRVQDLVPVDEVIDLLGGAPGAS